MVAITQDMIKKAVEGKMESLGIRAPESGEQRYAFEHYIGGAVMAVQGRMLKYERSKFANDLFGSKETSTMDTEAVLTPVHMDLLERSYQEAYPGGSVQKVAATYEAGRAKGDMVTFHQVDTALKTELVQAGVEAVAEALNVPLPVHQIK